MAELGDLAQITPLPDRIGRKPQHRRRLLDPDVLVVLRFHSLAPEMGENVQHVTILKTLPIRTPARK
jgi:hypothetical protein